MLFSCGAADIPWGGSWDKKENKKFVNQKIIDWNGKKTRKRNRLKLKIINIRKVIIKFTLKYIKNKKIDSKWPHK
jgi:23S rRNA maturation-related 3'-5' exoribonuclease YhaM